MFKFKYILLCLIIIFCLTITAGRCAILNFKPIQKEQDTVHTQEKDDAELMRLEKITNLKWEIINLINNEITYSLSEDVKVIATICPDDLSGYFTVLLPYKLMTDNLQEQAKQQNYTDEEDVRIRIDAITKEYHVLKKKIDKHYDAYIEKVIEPTEDGGFHSLKLTTKYTNLPKEMQRSAKHLGYKKYDKVNFIFYSSDNNYEILPPRIKYGFLVDIMELDGENRKQALIDGYKVNDKVWCTFGNSFSDIVVISKEKIGSGPIMEITKIAALLLDDGSTAPYFKGVMKSEDLSQFSPTYQLDAYEKGYKEGDLIEWEYSGKTGEVIFIPKTEE